MAVIEQKITEQYAAYNGDSLEVMEKIPDGKIHFSVYSPPFCGLYQYSSSERDLSNCASYDEFFEHYGFFVQAIHRITMPGRCTAVHCTDIPTGNSGGDGFIDFPGDVIRLHQKHGWKFKARHAIWKEPLAVRNRTMTKDLAHKTIVDDSIDGGVAAMDQLIIFQRSGTNPVPVEHPTGFDYYAGGCLMPADILRYKNWAGDQKQNRFSHWIWRRYASSVWDDVRMNRVLPYHDCKEPDDEKHVHPLQLDIIERAIQMRTNPGETVWTPFMGVGSEVFSAVRLGRRGIGAELKSSYYRQAIQNLEAASLEAEPQARLEFDEDFSDSELDEVLEAVA